MALANATILGTTTTLLTSANAGGTAVVAIILRNSDSVARTVTVHARPSGEAVAAQNTILVISIDAGETYVFNDKLLLSNTDVISALADSASVVYATVSYLNL